MSKLKIKRITALIMSLLIIAGSMAVGSFAEQKVAPLFTISDAKTRQGEEFDVTIKFAQDVTPSTINIAALDVSLVYSSDVYTAVSAQTGNGLTSAFDKLSDGTSLHLEHGYVFNYGVKEPGEVKWSMSTLNGFTFKKDSVFAVVTLKANDISSLDGGADLKVVVTNAMTKDFKDTTSMYTDAANKVDLEVNLSKLCNWENNLLDGTYTLAKFNDVNATKFTIPDTYGETLLSSKPVAKIKCGAFAYCTKLESIVIGNNVKSIEPAAFFNCSNLKNVTIYSDNAAFGDKAFMNCSSDLTIKCRKGSTAEKYAQANGIKVVYFGNIADLSVTGLEGEKYYNDGIPARFENLKFIDGSKTLVENKDYKLVYENNTKVGTATIHVTGMGEYVGTRDITFEVKCPYHYTGSRYYTEVAFYADCAEGGKLVKDCTFCKYHDESTKLEAKSHVKDREVTVKEATCTAAGEKAWTCKDCGAYLDRTATPVAAHEYELYTIEEATCKKAGSEILKCKNCGETKGEAIVIPQKEHKVDWTVVKEPTCMENGLEKFVCPYCLENDGGDIEAREIKAEGKHIVDEQIVKEATCGETGLKVTKCKVCGEVLLEEVLPKTEAHTYTSGKCVYTEPTCTEPGYRYSICDVCGAEGAKVEYKAAFKHSYETVEIESATCTKKGTRGQVCSRCKDTLYTEEIPALGHDYPAASAVIVRGTCMVDGVEGIQCRTCGEIKEGTKKVTTARGYHTYGTDKVVLEATCTQQGIKERTCSACGDVRVEIIPVSGHKEVYEPSVLATYKHTGIDKAVCEYCKMDMGKTRVSDKIVPDIDNDKKITATDALMILQHATKLKVLTGDPLRNADCNGDAAVNSTDALLTLQLSVKLISAD